MGAYEEMEEDICTSEEWVDFFRDALDFLLKRLPIYNNQEQWNWLKVVGNVKVADWIYTCD